MSLPPLVEPAPALTVVEVRRYSRHLIIPDVGMAGQKRLKNAKVLCVGAGGREACDLDIAVEEATWGKIKASYRAEGRRR